MYWKSLYVLLYHFPALSTDPLNHHFIYIYNWINGVGGSQNAISFKYGKKGVEAIIL